MKQRPKFQKPTATGATADPEELFQTLSGRAKSHGYLRGPQQDALREYAKIEAGQDVAFELPTGAGKTTVGLLIAEWQRRTRKGRAAYLALTNQLASQVIEEAERLTIPIADLRGNRDQRSPGEVGKFQDGFAVAISTYSNMFNTNPVIRDCEAIVLDDAHGGGDYAGGMWTVRISRDELDDTYQLLVATLQPLMTESQRAALSDPFSASRVAIVDLDRSASAKDQLIATIDALPGGSSPSYSWSLVRGHLDACHIFVSRDAVSLRPYITPTFDHGPFSSASRRIYLSATLGDVEDLKRAYAIENVKTIRVAHKQDGRRYLFAPGLAMGDDQVLEAVARIWSDLEPKRAVAIAPSYPILGRLQVALMNAIGTGEISFISAKAIEDSLRPFTESKRTVLGLASRYDGLDLPDDDCRLLVLAESPRATNDLETNLSSAWKLGPALRWREATRLAQGMGRCTRNATDFAVIILLGQSLINAITNPSLLRLLPPTLQAEIEWGKTQTRAHELDPDALANMVLGLIDDGDYRKDADQSIVELIQHPQPSTELKEFSVAAKEVGFAKAIWLGDYSSAHQAAREIADLLSGPEWAGYRCWWLYLASIAARLACNESAQIESLRRAKSTGINSGWLDAMLRRASGVKERQSSLMADARHIVAERIWNSIDELGWSGPKFAKFCSTMISELEGVHAHKTFHSGLVRLGTLMGATATAPTQQGDPDVIWRFADQIWACFEAKSEKLAGGSGLAKRDLLEAKGHVHWVNFFKSQGKGDVDVTALVVAQEKKLHPVAEPHKESLFFLGTADVLDWGKESYRALLDLRTTFAGQDFPSARVAFVEKIGRLHIDLGSTLARLRENPL